MKNNRFNKMVGLGGVAGVLLTASGAMAFETADDKIFQAGSLGKRDVGMLSLERLRDAQETMVRDASVQRLLSKGHDHAFSIVQRISDAGMETTKFQHFFKGVEVVGAKVFHHRGQVGTEVRSEVVEFDLDTKPTLSQEQAGALARSLVPSDRGLQSVPELMVLPSVDDQTARLIFWVSTTGGEDLEAGRDILVDAHSGEILADMSRNIEIAPVNVFSTTLLGQDVPNCQKTNEAGFPVALNLAACSKAVVGGKAAPSADIAARRAAVNSKSVLAYFQSVHGRNSFDNKGSASVSLVHIGKKFDNAFWNSDLKLMAYGDGDGVESGDFTRALDVAGHEMTHGVVSETAKLIYKDQSGALNEAFADFFGKMIANDGNWVVGKKLFLNPNNKGIRDLAIPGNLVLCVSRDEAGNCLKTKPYPAKMSERFPSFPVCNRSNDNCWVHVNSTIPGHAAYLVSQAITRKKAEKLFYRVLTHYMSETSNFNAFASASVTACAQLFDLATCSKVKAAFTEVGL